MVRVLFYASIISLVVSAGFLFLPLNLSIAVACLLFLLFVLFLIFKRKNKFNNAFMLFICFAFSVYGIFTVLRIEDVEKLNGKTAVIEGYITEDAESYDTYCAFILNTTRVEIDGTTENIPQEFKIRITESGDFAFSSFVNIKAEMKLKKIEDQYKNYSYSQKIYLTAENAEVVSCTPMENKPIYYCSHLIAKGINKILYSNMGYEDAALSSAVLLGDESGLTEKFYNNSKVTGVTHMLVVSGTHISIITMALIKLLKRIKFPDRLRPFLMLGVVYLIISVCGFSASVLRAGLTYVVYFIGEIFYRKSDGLNALGAASILLLFDSPFLFYNLGYLLSYVATYAVLALTEPIYKIICKLYIPGFIGNIYRGAGFILAQTLAATFATLPISMLAFGYFSVISPITNLLLATAVNGILVFSIFAVMLAAVPVVNIFSYAFFFALTYLSKFCQYIINLLGELENTLCAYEPIHILAWILLALALAGYVFSQRIKDFIRVYKTTVISSISLFLVGVIIFTYTYLKPMNYTKLSIVNVGNGICAIVSYKESSVLIGLGDNSSDHKRINDRIFKLGKRGVDLVLIPTTTKDYCGGFETLDNIKANYVYANRYGTYNEAIKNYKNVEYFENSLNGFIGEINYRIDGAITMINTPDATIELRNESYFNKPSNADILITLNYIPENYEGMAIICGNKISNKKYFENFCYVENDVTVNIGD